METIVQDVKQSLPQLLPSSPHTQFEEMIIPGYERVLKITNKEARLTALIALHDLTLGPALGGTRIQPYPSLDAALDDVLRLAKGMTHKSAIAEVGFGGGKSVIIADPKKDKTPALLKAFGAAVEMLQGAYICAEDVGCSPEDVLTIRQATRYVVGLPQAASSGDPGPFTAWGIFRGIQATCKKVFGTDVLEGRTIAVQGLGNVGSNLVPLLFWAGAHLILSDIDGEKLHAFAKKYDARMAPPDQILSTECDLLAPCALGGILNDATIPTLRCRAVAGGANNQLRDPLHADALRNLGILYAPDFVINAGGLLNVSAELETGGYSSSLARGKIHRIYDYLLAIYEIAEKNRESTHAAALSLAEYRLKYGIGKRVVPPTFHHSA